MPKRAVEKGMKMTGIQTAIEDIIYGYIHK
jgi:hypothetical protein